MKSTNLLFTAICITICVQISHQLGTGAPNTACQTLLPNHRGNVPQETPSPYVLTPLVQLKTGNILVRISAEDRSVVGFFIQGRRAIDDTSVGSFATPFAPSPYQPVSCDIIADSATHTSPTLKNEVILEWSPPIGFSGQVYFTGTVLQEFSVFWGGVRSPIVTL